jgi:hypothetical protein
MSRIEVVAGNIRNVRDPEEKYPSTVLISAAVFDSGRLSVDGHADFLAVPHLGLKGKIELDGVPLERLEPVASYANLRVHGGVLSADGDLEYAPEVLDAHLKTMQIDGIELEYFHTAATEAEEAERLEKVKETTVQLAREPRSVVEIDEVAIRRGTLSYAHERQPGYRLFLSDVRADLHGVSTQPDADMAHFLISGQFMDSGPSWLDLWFRQRNENPEFDMAVEVKNTDLASLNQLLRGYGDFDVVGGSFSLYSQLSVRDQKVEGYVKPFFYQIDVFDRRQDSDKAVFHQLYERFVGGIALLLENDDDTVATRTEVRGRLSSPDLSAWDITVNFVRNAFFKEILPGFDRALREADGMPADG